jgi:hypothetical protein
VEPCTGAELSQYVAAGLFGVGAAFGIGAWRHQSSRDPSWGRHERPLQVMLAVGGLAVFAGIVVDGRSTCRLELTSENPDWAPLLVGGALGLVLGGVLVASYRQWWKVSRLAVCSQCGQVFENAQRLEEHRHDAHSA